MELIDNFVDMLKTPFIGELDFVHLFLLVGLVILCIIAWGFILRHIQMAASELV